MDFIILLLINTFMGVIFYLVISLKLEKSASDFREKKLHEEMDKIIKEFNRTAERNISILENRIAVLRRLLQQKGEGGIDIRVDDQKDDSPEDAISIEQFEKKNEEQGNNIYRSMTSADVQSVTDDTDRERSALLPFLLEHLKKYLSFLNKKNITNSWQDESQHSPDDSNHANERLFPQILIADSDNGPVTESKVDVSGPAVPLEDKDETQEGIAEEDIIKLLSETDDTYTAISMLHRKGLHADDISRYVGLPVGEIRLVLNLNDSKF